MIRLRALHPGSFLAIANSAFVVQVGDRENHFRTFEIPIAVKIESDVRIQTMDLSLGSPNTIPAFLTDLVIPGSTVFANILRSFKADKLAELLPPAGIFRFIKRHLSLPISSLIERLIPRLASGAGHDRIGRCRTSRQRYADRNSASRPYTPRGCISGFQASFNLHSRSKFE